MNAQRYRDLLETDRARLVELRDGLAEGATPVEAQTAADPAAGGHLADAGSEMFERSRDLSIVEDFDAQLGEIDHAIRRLEAGTYGRCEACGREIGDARLAARPMTRFCIDDQKEAEREAHLR
ncbi:MAG TPA: TraR/DksA C4-type zinc finger protein [Actinomycetota bacterium]|nr:TraR/DksA C4-type zinc finger protein [Actinomycetota bacterium]